MVLTDAKIRNAKPTDKAYNLTDSEGLSLVVFPSGRKFWHYRYYWLGTQKRMSLGRYPEQSLREARHLRDEARALLAKGINPCVHRKHQRQAAGLAEEHTFQAVFDRWLAHRKLSLRAGRQSTVSQIERIFANDVLPVLGKRSIYDIVRPELIEVVAKIERRGALTIADKVRTWLRQMFRYALVIVQGLQQNPAFDLSVVAVPQRPVRHNPFLRLPELPAMLQTLRHYPGRLQTQLGLRLLLLTGVRTGELRWATPDQFDLDHGLWIIPPAVVKQLQLRLRKESKRADDVPAYVVPLSLQAIEIVRFLLDQCKPAQRYLFPHISCLRERMSENTLNSALHRMGYGEQLTGHGIRGTISTALNEIGYPKVWIESQLSHADRDKVSAAYNHAEYVEQRRGMMQDWADRLDLLEQNQVALAAQPLAIHMEGVTPTPAAAVDGIIQNHGATPATAELVTIKGGGWTFESGIHAERLPAVHGMAPVLSEEQRQRKDMLEVYNSPHLIPAAEFAKIEGKSRRWVSYAIQRRQVLALKIGHLGHRIPDWHLDPVKDQLIQTVLKYAVNAGGWDIYRALAQPQRVLGDRSPIEALTVNNAQEVLMAVCFSVRDDTSH